MNISNMEQRVQELERQMREHFHNGVEGQQIEFANLIGRIKTITVAADLTAILAQKPRDVSNQIIIDTTTATKKLYVYDATGDVWRSVTIA